MKAKIRVLVVLLLVLFSTTGCWDELPYTSRAAALALVIVAKKAGDWSWSFYFPNPTVTVSSISQIQPPKEFYAVTVTAPSLASAYQRIQQSLSRDLYLGQAELIILSQNIRSRPLMNFLAAYNREGVTPKTAYVVVGPPSLTKTLPVSPQEVIPSIYLTRFFDCRDCQTVYLSREVWQIWDDYMTPGISPTIPYATAPQTISRLAVYPSHGLPVIFTRRETKGWGFLTGRVMKETLTLHLPQGLVTLTEIHGKPKISVADGGDAVRVHATLPLVANLEQWPESAPLSPEAVQSISRAAEKEILGWCLEAIQRANRTHTDPFGFNRKLVFSHQEVVDVDHPEAWRYLPIDATVTVRLTIRRTGVSG